MPHASATRLFHRSVIRVGGTDRVGFLQGLISNDVGKVTTTNAIHAALLTPQGKFLHDMFVIGRENGFLIDCEAARAEDLIKRLTAYKLRSKVTFENLATTLDVWAIWPAAEIMSATVLFDDPRLPELGARAFVEKNHVPADIAGVDMATYDAHRLALGVPDGSRDLEIEKSTLAEGNFDLLNGIDWKKGCYVGQELTARMHYRGLAKKRLFPVRIDGAAPPPGALLAGETGEMRSSTSGHGLALLKIEAARQSMDEETPLSHGETRLWPQIPAWMKFDAPPANR